MKTFVVSCTLLLWIHYCALVEMGWIDYDTSEKHKKLTSLITGKPYDLVFSDEFNVEGREFHDGYDPKWTSLQKDDYTNHALQYYNSSLVRTKNGYLSIGTIIQNITYKTDAMHHKTKIYQSGMIQGWNKFCFTGGIVEIKAKLPGRSDIGGLWPAMWLLGNLARATYVGSSNNIWPWSYNHCDSNRKNLQFISACNEINPFGLNNNQGRGAPEIDILEAMAGTDKVWNSPIRQPFLSASLQIAPGFEDYRPGSAGYPIPEKWYDNQYIHYGNQTSLNNFYYGDFVNGHPNYFLDAISANHQLTKSHYDSFHTYRVEWHPGTAGYISWYVDGQFVYRIDSPALNLTGAIIPEEPMYIVLNTAVSSNWGFPGCAADCLCCHDPRREECLCSVPKDMMENFPAEFLIDYVRVYQDKERYRDVSHTLGCSPKTHPTKYFIEGHPDFYKEMFDEQILMSIPHGGGECTQTMKRSCGIGGKCSQGKCVCGNGNYTGPFCQAATGFDDTTAAYLREDFNNNNNNENSFQISGIFAILLAMMLGIVLGVLISFGIAYYRKTCSTSAGSSRRDGISHGRHNEYQSLLASQREMQTTTTSRNNYKDGKNVDEELLVLRETSYQSI